MLETGADTLVMLAIMLIPWVITISEHRCRRLAEKDLAAAEADIAELVRLNRNKDLIAEDLRDQLAKSRYVHGQFNPFDAMKEKSCHN